MKKLKPILLSIIFVLNTSACSANHVEQQPKVVPEIQATKPKIVPDIKLPSQETIATKAWQRTGQAMPIKSNNGMIKYPFGETLPTVTCSPLHICDIELEAGEKVQNVAIGDQVRWLLSPANSGSNNGTIPHVIVKPTDENISTNLVITTDKRTYYLYLTSKASGYITRLSFYYPHDLVQSWQTRAALDSLSEQNKIAEFPSLTAAELDFDYEISGSSKFRPVRVFNDKKHVYLQMPALMQSYAAPILMVVGSDNKAQLVNYRVKNTFYIVDRLFDKAELILGVGRTQEKVIISYRPATKACFFNCH